LKKWIVPQYVVFSIQTLPTERLRLQSRRVEFFAWRTAPVKKKWLIPVLLICVSIGGYWFLTVPATTIPNGSDSKALFTAGPFEVISEPFKAVDESRPTQAYKDFPGRPVRVLKGGIWRPAGPQRPGPLLVYSHGFLSFHEEGLYLMRFLASHGYTVLAVDYPLTGFHAPDGPLMRDIVNQPGDVSFLIDTMLKRNADPADVLFATIDPKKIAVAGTSLGGLTAILATFHRQMRDPRIAASISIAGPTSMFTADFFSGSDVPFLMIYGGGDVIVPYNENATPVLQKNPGSILVTLRDASHAGFAQPASTLMRFIANPDGVGCRAVRAGLKDELSGQQDQFMSLLGSAEEGVDMHAQIKFCSSLPIPVAMQAARQHMFTALASYAFLDSVFADDASVRDASRRYLLETLPSENSTEVSVSL
jgi:pimeloyl-ACP methyl ester carboxylesterase